MKKWSQEARIYNALVLSWTEIEPKSQLEDAAWRAAEGGGAQATLPDVST